MVKIKVLGKNGVVLLQAVQANKISLNQAGSTVKVSINKATIEGVQKVDNDLLILKTDGSSPVTIENFFNKSGEPTKIVVEDSDGHLYEGVYNANDFDGIEFQPSGSDANNSNAAWLLPIVALGGLGIALAAGGGGDSGGSKPEPKPAPHPDPKPDLGPAEYSLDEVIKAVKAANRQLEILKKADPTIEKAILGKEKALDSHLTNEIEANKSVRDVNALIVRANLRIKTAREKQIKVKELIKHAQELFDKIPLDDPKYTINEAKLGELNKIYDQMINDEYYAYQELEFLTNVKTFDEEKQDIADLIAKYVEGIFSFIKTGVVENHPEMAKILEDIYKSLTTEVFSMIGDIIKGAVNGINDKVKNFTDLSFHTIEALSNAISSTISVLLSKEGFGKIGQIISDALAKLVPQGHPDFKPDNPNIFNQFGKFLTDLLTTTQDSIKGILIATINSVPLIPIFLKQPFIDMINKVDLVKLFAPIAAQIDVFLKPLAELWNILNPVQNAKGFFEALYTLFKEIPLAIADAIKNGWGAFTKSIGNDWNNIKGDVNKIIDIFMKTFIIKPIEKVLGQADHILKLFFETLPAGLIKDPAAAAVLIKLPVKIVLDFIKLIGEVKHALGPGIKIIDGKEVLPKGIDETIKEALKTMSEDHLKTLVNNEGANDKVFANAGVKLLKSASSSDVNLDKLVAKDASETDALAVAAKEIAPVDYSSAQFNIFNHSVEGLHEAA